MALDRQSIERRDFPLGQRGYDPDAVDAHLAALADEVAEFKRSARRRGDMLASAASEQVRAIVQAAESSAAEIQRAAEEEARDIRAEAEGEAGAIREQAAEQAREYVGRVSQSASSVLQRLESMEHELQALIRALQDGSHRLDSDLQVLQQDLSGVGEAVRPHRFQPDTGAAPGAVPEGEVPGAVPEGAVPGAVPEDAAPGPPGEGGPGFDTPLPEPAPEAAEFAGVVGEPEPAPGSEPADDAEGARLIALNMALNGTPREEAARYLADNFQLAEPGRLLDEVYASVEG